MAGIKKRWMKLQLQDMYSTDALTPTYRQQKHVLDTSALLRGAMPSKRRSTYCAGSQGHVLWCFSPSFSLVLWRYGISLAHSKDWPKKMEDSSPGIIFGGNCSWPSSVPLGGISFFTSFFYPLPLSPCLDSYFFPLLPLLFFFASAMLAVPSRSLPA